MTTENPSPLISCEWLADRLTASGIVILDATFFLPNQARNARGEFQSAHIPGAQFFDIDVIADSHSPLSHMLPGPKQFSDAAGLFGIDNNTNVIVYDNNSFMASARAWWTFRVFGHQNVAVLDGGVGRWKALSGPLESAVRTPTPSQFTAVLNQQLVCNLAQMRELSEKRSRRILDARSPGRFSGSEPEVRPGLRSGHIPGSANVHHATLVNRDTCCLRSAEALDALFKQAGVAPDKPIVTTCGSGVTAAILALGLYRLGRRDVPVYDGSWTEWGGREDTPVETGA